MKVLVCGGRDYDDEARIYAVLDAEASVVPITMIIQGGARGADTLARLWSESRSVDCLSVPANWSKHGRGARPIRNARMLDYKPDLVIAFPGGIGTANMIKQARASEIKVFEIRP